MTEGGVAGGEALRREERLMRLIGATCWTGSKVRWYGHDGRMLGGEDDVPERAVFVDDLLDDVAVRHLHRHRYWWRRVSRHHRHCHRPVVGMQGAYLRTEVLMVWHGRSVSGRRVVLIKVVEVHSAAAAIGRGDVTARLAWRRRRRGVIQLLTACHHRQHTTRHSPLHAHTNHYNTHIIQRLLTVVNLVYSE